MSAPQTLPHRTTGPHVPVSTEYVPRPPLWHEVGERNRTQIIDDWWDKEINDFHAEVFDEPHGDQYILEKTKALIKRWEAYRDEQLERLAR